MTFMFEQFKDWLAHAWNAFNGRDRPYRDYGPSYSTRADKLRVISGNERTIAMAIYNRIALDTCSVDMHHVRTNDDGIFEDIINDGLEKMMTLEANIDQTSRAYMQDLLISLFDEGFVAEVPIDIDQSDTNDDEFEIESIRTGKIIEWMPQHVRILVYNERTGEKEEIVMPKRRVSIHENPFFAIMNEPNSIFKRLCRKMEIMDIIDEMSGSDKLNMIVQLPYTVRGDLKRKEVQQRMKDLEDQLKHSQYGIAYAEATEKIVQLNRPLENTLLKQVEFLTNMFYSQLGITESIMNGTADEPAMLNYYNRTIEPLLSGITLERKRKFLSEDQRNNNESIMFFRDPFKLTPVNDLANVADRLTRNEILSSNEFRGIIGYKPSNDPRANELVNKNLKMAGETTQQRPAQNTKQNEVPRNEQPDS